MKITQVKIARIDGPHLLGFAEVTFDDSFSVGDFLIFREPTGYRIVMPRVKLQNGIYQEIVSPLDPTTQKMIDDAVIGEYEKVAGKFSRRRKKRIYWPTSPGGSKPADTPISDALAAPQTSKSFVVVLLAIIKSLGAPERPVDTLTIVGIIVCLILEVLVIIGFFKS